jgi:hypothetical protein
MTHNLVEYNGKRKVRTVLYNSSYQLCKGLKHRCEMAPLVPGTYFKIENNDTNISNTRVTNKRLGLS